LRPVSYTLSLLAALFGLVSTATFAISELFYFVSSIPVLDANVQQHLTQEQHNLFIYSSLALMGMAEVYSTRSTVLLQRCVDTSYIDPHTYLPWLGILLMIAGAGFIAKNLLVILSPQYDSDFPLMPIFAAMIAFTGWLLTKGIDVGKWPDRIVSNNRAVDLTKFGSDELPSDTHRNQSRMTGKPSITDKGRFADEPLAIHRRYGGAPVVALSCKGVRNRRSRKKWSDDENGVAAVQRGCRAGSRHRCVDETAFR
jgi:uncharacterized protein DUF4386